MLSEQHRSAQPTSDTLKQDRCAKLRQTEAAGPYEPHRYTMQAVAMFKADRLQRQSWHLQSKALLDIHTER